jgi:hypothetical protein
MTLPWFQLAHQVLPVPVGRNQMLGYPRKGHSSSHPTGADVVLQVAVTLGRRHAGRARSDP